MEPTLYGLEIVIIRHMKPLPYKARQSTNNKKAAPLGSSYFFAIAGCIFGVASGQGTEQFIQVVQWAFGSEKRVLDPYSFSTGCTGQSEEHQPLFQSYAMPMPNPIAAQLKSSHAVAGPLLLKTACRSDTMLNRASTATNQSME
jgi:hypothetical protein